ncbi:MAG: hypothetical protein AAGA90_05450 [Actinomycetota bacterium]
MRELARQAATTVLALVVCTLIGVGGLIFAELVPDIWVVDALEAAEGRGEITAEERPLDNAGIQVDEATECTTLSVGLGETAGQNIFDTTALAPNLGSCWRLVGNLNPYDGATAAANRDTYLRYWHGSAPIVRPVLATVGLSGLRVVGMLAIAAAGAAVFGVVRRSSGTAAAAGLALPVVLTTSILSLPGSIHQALAFAVGLAGAALVGTIAAGGLTGPRVWYPSLVAGAAFVYVDLLTAVPGQWLLAAALVGLASFQQHRPMLETAGWTALSGVAWFVGYLGMWFGKWVYAALVLGPRLVYDDVTDTIERRIDGDTVYSDPGFGNAISDNIEVFRSRPFATTVVVLAVAIVLVGVARRPVAETAVRAVVAATAAVPFIWFEVASNHSQIHAWFTYRSIPMAIGVVVMASLATRPASVASG